MCIQFATIQGRATVPASSHGHFPPSGTGSAAAGTPDVSTPGCICYLHPAAWLMLLLQPLQCDGQWPCVLRACRATAFRGHECFLCMQAAHLAAIEQADLQPSPCFLPVDLRALSRQVALCILLLPEQWMPACINGSGV